MTDYRATGLSRPNGAVSKGTVPICPSMEGVTAADLCDPCHPTEAGYQKVANNWYRDLRPALERVV